MEICPIASLLLSILAFVAGCISALFAWKALSQEVTPAWANGSDQFEPVDPMQSQIGWTIGILEASRQSSALNKLAVYFAILGAIASLASGTVGILPSLM